MVRHMPPCKCWDARLEACKLRHLQLYALGHTCCETRVLRHVPPFRTPNAARILGSLECC
eukprot:1160212-Pelagomonas_calceolata.AAC.5